MDSEMLRLLAHLDQTRSEMRAVLRELGSDEMARLVKVCARGALEELDERTQLVVGMLAVVAMFDLMEPKAK